MNQQRPTPPPHYWAAMGVADELRQQNNDINSNQQQRSLTWLLPLTESETEQQSLSANQQNYHNDLPNNSLSTYPIEPPPSYNELTNQQ
uniref:Uncharacterized protein n=1 Tax=Meloidogyne javanica TaxID=6303 RepID=A0A915MB26_MELJA